MSTRTAPAVIRSHWYQLVDGLQASPRDFYGTLERAVRERSVPDASFARIEYPEGGPFSPRREYLRVQRREHTFDICGAPFGRGFFFSWWLGELPSGCVTVIGGVPVLGAFVERFVRPSTYYRTDTALMFQEAIHGAVLEVVDGMTQAKGIRPLTELERKPVRGPIGG